MSLLSAVALLEDTASRSAEVMGSSFVTAYAAIKKQGSTETFM